MPTNRDYARSSTQHALEYTFRAFASLPAAGKNPALIKRPEFLAVQAGLGIVTTGLLAVKNAREKAGAHGRP